MTTDKTIKYLHEFELFQDLSEEELKDISPFFTLRNFKRSEMIYRASDVASNFIFVLSGSIKIFRLSKDGKEQIIRIIHPQEFTGELALFEGYRKAYAIALEKSMIYTIEHQKFKELLKYYPDLALKMIEILSLRLHLSEAQTSLLSMNTSKERLWIYLNDEAINVNGKQIFYFSQTKRFIAAYLGMSSETLSRVLHQLEDEKRIKEHLDQYIEILD